MLKRVLVAAALIVASPALVSAQDIFISFDRSSRASSTVAPAGTVGGTAYVFADQMFGFDAIDLNIETSDPNVVQITGGTEENNTFDVIGGTAFDSSALTFDAATGGANLFAVNVTENGINPAVSALFNPGFEAGVGANGAVLLATLDYTVTGAGDATIGFSLGDQGALQLPNTVLDPVFGTGSFTAEAIPEPSSLALFVLGSIGLVSRRKRS